MNDKRRDLVTIGIFANSTRVSVKALRLYDSLGILKPAYTDPDSRYRYYHIEQIHTARLIRMMRVMDMPLALIRDILEASPEDAEQAIQQYLTAMQARLAQAENMVHTLVHTLKGDISIMALEVTVVTREKQAIISSTHHITVDKLDDTIRDGVTRLQAIAEAAGVQTGTPFGIYIGNIDHESDGPIEICLPTAELLTVTEEGITAREMPEEKVASVHLHEKECFFPDVLKGYDAIHDWLRQNGYKHVVPPHEIWHSMGAPEHMEITWAFVDA